MNLIEDDNTNDDDTLQLPLAAISKPLSIQTARSLSSYSNTTASSTTATTTTNTTTRPNTSVIKLQFINTAHPSESTTAKRISQIRSHVAKDSHARRRQRKATKACNCSASSSSAEVAAEQTDRSEVSDSTSTSSTLLLSHASRSSSCIAGAGKEGLGSRGFRRIAPKNGGAARRANSPGPRQLIGDARKDGWNGSFAWNLSDDEYSIFNFYLDWVLQYGYEICFPHDQVPVVMKRLKATYVPFAIRQPSLLACLLYIAYHRRSLNTDDVDEAVRCSFMTERYRLACIEMMKKAIAAEEKPTYQTIALAMLLSSEARSSNC
ncbi:hypothetical protein TARUN_3370 [Trichoderma arundinaceum]|uniref:Uncharacterized protein n=1 Tax=Trichoderma arundinaceum TaxID=490622 RepID=A0A395NS91_TRIAR|nr:hypothetical protein TARUN_3370 [Trichoderma arundinaceum]